MSKSASVAPKERINIKYVPATGDQIEEKELPLNLVIVGDHKGRTEDTSIEERQLVSIDKNNFNDVMEKSSISLNFNVQNRLQEDSDEELSINLDIKNLSSFNPDQIAKQVPEINNLIQLREALTALKNPMGNIKAFREAIAHVLSDDTARKNLLNELQITDKD
ncbi:type VI secretion system contractile sheath small subunit [Gilliamella sp. Pas-s25]|uniref:type VI secretion system contractile sheath small subunit n=1 Tax=Gilliamella sp. Pas-s25 TaxID=2687310 RepID=UPI00135EAF07|nr:type VI secretion system contractile sheath small subunit [Gilliamella sp. Pas-s25]MWP62724.1 type VI secretion system contractile sheath small subunit [Gilliamella sp. Pas-s25]